MPKIVLRPWQKLDAQELAAVANNRNIWKQVRDALPSPYTVMDALNWIAHANAQTPICNFAIVCDGKVTGSIGCKTKDDISRKTTEIGYFVGENYWGRGIATEAVSLLTDFISTRMDIIRIEATVFAANHASMRVLHKNGFCLESIQRKAAIKENEVIDHYIWVRLL